MYFRTLDANEKPIIHQIIRKKAKQDFMKEMFLELRILEYNMSIRINMRISQFLTLRYSQYAHIFNVPWIENISILSKHFTNYLKTGETKDFDSLTCIYHIANNDLSTFVWLEENKK